MELVGMIFKYAGKTWKVTGNRKPGSTSAPVISCSKTGKEYITKNGFSIRFLESVLTPGSSDSAALIRYPGVYVEEGETAPKANIEVGNKVGAVKRRITFLKNAIADYQKELDQLTS